MESQPFDEPQRGANPNPTDGECAKRILADLQKRQLPDCHIITFANEKGGVGKSTLAFHAAIALARRGHRVLAIDLDARQKSLARAIERRDGTATCLGIDLPTPRCSVLDKPSAAVLVQELVRLGSQSDVIVIDAPGRDDPAVRRAIALADTLVTPINASFFDLDVLGQFDPVGGGLRRPSPFAQMVLDLRAEQQAQGMEIGDWIVPQNRVRNVERSHLGRMQRQLAKLAEAFDLRLIKGLRERVSYRALLQYGLTGPDLGEIPQLRGARLENAGELDTFIADLRLPEASAPAKASVRPHGVKVPLRTRENYVRSLQRHVAPELPRAAVA